MCFRMNNSPVEFTKVHDPGHVCLRGFRLIVMTATESDAPILPSDVRIA
jgi:hypothetical protein